MDQFEKQIKEFGSLSTEPPKGHNARFEKKLDMAFNGKNEKTLNWHLIAYAAAILAFISIVTVLFLNKPTDSPLILASENDEIIESELFFQQQVLERIYLIESLDTKNMNQLIDTAEFDKSLQNLKNDLQETPGDQRVVDAVLTTYMLKIEALDDLVNILKKTS